MQRKRDLVLRLATPVLGPAQVPLISDVRRHRKILKGEGVKGRGCLISKLRCPPNSGRGVLFQIPDAMYLCILFEPAIFQILSSSLELVLHPGFVRFSQGGFSPLVKLK